MHSMAMFILRDYIVQILKHNNFKNKPAYHLKVCQFKQVIGTTVGTSKLTIIKYLTHPGVVS